jgi:hypothetical protein
MLRNYQRLFGWLVGMALVHSAAAFTVWGPVETWQTPDLDYINRLAVISLFGGNATELGGDKVLAAGSRVGVPVITYAFDSTFAEYFGVDGMNAVDQAMAIINGLPNASAASPGLTEFVQQGNEQINYTAQALGLFDLKSATLTLLLEHLGLQGETHVYDLSARDPPPGTPPPCFFDYLVINRNYDPVTYNPSTFVNGIQYGYVISDLCPVENVADAIEYPKDVTQNAQSPFTAAATFEGQVLGGYYLNITRDDFGGLRWLYRKSNLINEGIDPTSFVTSVGSSPFSVSQFTGTSNVLTGALFGGVEKVRFVKTPFDSILGSTFTPRTYNYSKLAIVNGQLTTVQFTRFITQPDIIFSTADLIVRGTPIVVNAYTRNIGFLPPPIASTGGGPLPNVFLPQQQVTYDNAFPVLENEDPTSLSDNTGVQIAAWGSFGSSSAAPIVYPNGQSIIDLENQVLSGQTGSTSVSTTYNPFGFGNLTTGGTVTFLGNY